MERHDASIGAAARQHAPEAVGHGAPGTVVRGGEAVPAGLQAEAEDFEATPGQEPFRRALERLVTDEEYRRAAMADPGRVARDYGLDPGQDGLLGAACWAAYGPEVAGHGMAW